MIEQRARVMSTDGGFAVVQTSPAGGCSSCGVAGGCGVSKLGKLLPQRTRLWRVPNDLAVRPGDEVTLGLPDDALLTSALLAYLPPMIGLLAGAMICTAWFGGDLWPVAGAGNGLLLGLAASRLLSRRRAGQYMPRMVARHPAAAPVRIALHRPKRTPSENYVI